jgi:hypothetical protein
MMMRRRERLLVALAGASAVAVIAYALVRSAERAFFPEPNPALVIGPLRSGFVFRSLLALYSGGMGGFGAYALASSAPHASARWLGITIGGAAIAALAQAVIAP